MNPWWKPLLDAVSPKTARAIKPIADQMCVGPGGSRHSSRAETLGYVLSRLEEAGVPYRLDAHPGLGYYVQSFPEERR